MPTIISRSLSHSLWLLIFPPRTAIARHPFDAFGNALHANLLLLSAKLISRSVMFPFPVEDIHRNASDMPGNYCLGKGRLIYHRPSGSVHDPSTGLKAADHGLTK